MRFTSFAARAIIILSVTAAIPAVLHSQIITERAPTTAPTIMSNGPVPLDVRVAGTPAAATVTWRLISAQRYTVTRTKDGDAMCCNVQSGDVPSSSLTSASWVDNNNGAGFQSSGTYTYTVTAWQADGHYGQVSVKWTRPDPANPTGFAAKQTGEGTAELSWQAVPNASYYTLWGPGAPAEGMRVVGTSKVLSGLGAGAKEWSITTRYDPAGVLLASSTWPKAQLNMISMSGMYRITLNGFQVVSPAKEVITLDGAGNEVFALSYVRVYDRTTGAVLREGSVESAVHGDTEGFGGRVPAGSAKPTGGLVQGDKFPGASPWLRGNSVSSTTFPLLLWEGPLTDGQDAVVVTPMIWEWQADAPELARGKVNMVNNAQKGISASLWSTVAGALSGAGAWNGPTQIPLAGLQNIWMGGSTSQPGVDLIIREENLTHAIGADKQVNFEKNKLWVVQNTGIVFTRELVEKVLNASTQIGGMGPGVVEVKWIEKYPGATASYTLYVQVARQ